MRPTACAPTYHYYFTSNKKRISSTVLKLFAHWMTLGMLKISKEDPTIHFLKCCRTGHVSLRQTVGKQECTRGTFSVYTQRSHSRTTLFALVICRLCISWYTLSSSGCGRSKKNIVPHDHAIPAFLLSSCHPMSSQSSACSILHVISCFGNNPGSIRNMCVSISGCYFVLSRSCAKTLSMEYCIFRVNNGHHDNHSLLMALYCLVHV